MDGFCQAFSSNLAPQKRLCKNGEKLIYNKLSLKTKNVDKEVIYLKHIILHFANLDVCCCFETSIFNSRNQLLKCQASTSSS